MTEQINKPVITGVSDPDRKAIEVLYRAFSEGADLLDEAVCSDWQDIPLAPGQAPGRDGMKPLIRAFQAAFPDGKIIVHEMIGGPGRAPTGRAFHMPIHEFHYVENGKVTHTWHLEDWLGWLYQVGAWPITDQEAAQ